ncbi:thioredoxin-disulfide reductase [Candidatus Kuenenbacteria bacterium HGW-Kuenenbacteria-1]|uniref:Thioredoxin reductase n=1 Tax=Candidatus Kuenenbacteria bacterium HGW-Kuenenbacteria-1 TaxID=2013812 RepID=A0A2N1UP85_9BACT|nr:MAG: thioredoxin-disulfide reductase [Candidatus Kuenenbacteria bacterium HGW-Kuenenbacteria-1]
MKNMYDVIIIGAGAAGMTAAIYTSRRMLKTLVISKDLGGQASLATEVENYPGFDEAISGFKIMQKFNQQARKFGVEFIFDEVEEIKPENDFFEIKTNTQNYQTKSVILAFGLTPRDLDVPGEEKFKGKGVSYCATCDALFYKDKNVAVIGGGNAALDATLLLSKIAKKVYLVHRRNEFKGDEILIQKIKEQKNIQFVLNSTIKEIKGAEFVKSIIVNKIDKENEEEIEVNGVFAEVGYEVKADFIKNLVNLDEKNQVITNKNCETSLSGIFAAGDATDILYKQIIISAGEGAKAALSAYKYIQEKGGKNCINLDWGAKK